MPETLTETWGATLRRDPGATAVIEPADGRVWTRAELGARAAAWGAALGEEAARAFRRKVGLAAANGIGWWEACLGLLSIGAVPVFIDSTEPVARRREIAEGVGACALWTEGTRLVKVTSGSSGDPRAWLFTDAQMLADSRQICATMGIRPGDLNLAAIPLGHSYGLGNLVIPLLDQGTPMVCADSPLPNALAGVCERWKPTVFPAVPALLDALVRGDVHPAALASLRTVISAGAAMPPALAAAFASRFHTRVHNFYGASETGGICYDRSGESTLSGRSVGAPLEGVSLRWTRGKRFRVVSAAVTAGGSFCPKDRGELNSRGELVLLGRVGRMVKLGAKRLDLGEAERVLRGVEGVRDVHVSVDASRPDSLVAVVASARLTPREIRSALQGATAAWKIPRRIIVLPSLPATARGKVDPEAIARLISRQEGRAGE